MITKETKDKVMCNAKKSKDFGKMYETGCGKVTGEIPVSGGKCIYCGQQSEIDDSISTEEQIKYYQENFVYMREKYWNLVSKIQELSPTDDATEKIRGLKDFLNSTSADVLVDQQGNKYFLEPKGFYIVGDKRLRRFYA